MIRTLFWKEYREQRVIAVTLALLTILTLLGFFQWKNNEGPSQYQAMNESALEVSVCLAFLCGLVTGAMLLAGEEEARTQPFLDVLPIWRKRLWLGKVLFGLVAVAFQIILIAALNTSFELIPDKVPTARAIAALAGCALYAFAWGLFGSALCRNVFSAIGLALAGQIIGMVIGIVIVSVLESVLYGGVGRENPNVLIVLAAVVMLPLPLVGSLAIYAGSDFSRSAKRSVGPILVKQIAAVRTWRVMLWLVWQQGRLPLGILAAMCLLTGLVAHMDGLIVWPLVSLVLGLVCGLTAFMGEQSGGSEVFLGTERVPAGRFWIHKVCLWLMLLVVLAGLFWLIPVVRAFTGEQHPGTNLEANRIWLAIRILGISPNLVSMIDAGTYAGLWLLHGFAIGQIFAMTCRKTVVAGFLSIGACLAVGAIWLPSVLYGGLHFWQILGAPLILLVGSRLAYWPWIGNRLISLRPLTGLIVCGLLAAGWIGAQLTYRVLEIPSIPQAFDLKAFIASLPTVEKNIAGRALKPAGKDLRPVYQAGSQRFRQQGALPDPGLPAVEGVPMGVPIMILPGKGGGSGGPKSRGGEPRRESPPTFESETTSVLRNGWGDPRKDHLELGEWLNRLFTDSWQKSAEEVRKASVLPPDVLIDPLTPPQELDDEIVQNTQNTGWIVNVFVLRGLHLQAGGDYKQALEHFFDALSVTRHMRHCALIRVFTAGLASENTALHAIDLWRHELGKAKQVSNSEKLGLLKTALDGLAHHEETLPSVLDCLKAEYLFVRNEVYDPKIMETYYGREKRSAVLHAAGEARLLEVLPWEKNRVDRLLDSVFAGWLRALALDLPTLREHMQADQQADQALHRSRNANRYVLGAWMPAEGDSQGQESRERLAALVDRSWLRDILPSSVSHLATVVPDNLSRLRLLRIRLAVALYKAQAGNEARLESLEMLVEMKVLPTIPINPLTGLAFSEKDLLVLPPQQGVRLMGSLGGSRPLPGTAKDQREDIKARARLE
jgi:ABC-type transport system involved in multi-copper enzyme maturation permease subunit